MSEQQGNVEVLPRRRLGDISAGGPVVPIAARNVDDAFRIARAMFVAHLAPDSYTEMKKDVPYPEEEAVARIALGIMKGAEVGFPPITAVNTIAIINGRPSIWGDGAQALIQERGHLDKMLVEQLGVEPDKVETGHFPDDFGFRVKMWRRGQEEPYLGEFTVRDAKRAHLWMNVHRKPWVEHPKRMLLIRARAFAQRDGFADDLMGLSIREEMEDITPAPAAQTNTDFLEDAPQRAIEHASPLGTQMGTTGEASGETLSTEHQGSPPPSDPPSPAAERPEGEPSPSPGVVEAAKDKPPSRPPPSGRSKPGMRE